MGDIDIEELKKAAPIIDYVDKFYPKKIKLIERSTNCCKSNCIWHSDGDSPSLAFFSNGTYKCFGCGKSGDVISFVQDQENLSFIEACKVIGDNVGYPITLTPPNPYHEAYKDTMDNHSRRYWYNLQTNQYALNYLNSRGLKKETLDLFRVGLTDMNEYKFRQDIGGISSRLSFPILENKIHNPKCIGMGYRTLIDEKPKYINDCNQEGKKNQDVNIAGVFVKGACLYGYPFAAQEIRKKKFVILTEGYIDVISMHQAGLKNTVSIMGTAVTEAQILLIKKMTNSVLFILDSDKAGINAMLKTLPLMFKHGLNVLICTLDKGMDPAELCLKKDFDTLEVYNEIKDNSIPAENFLVNTSVASYESFVIAERKKVLQSMDPILESMPEGKEKKIFTAMLYKRLDMK